MSESLISAGGEVAVENRTFRVRRFSVDGELGLFDALRDATKEALGAGSFYARSLPVAEWLREQGRHAEAADLTHTTGTLVATGVGLSDDAVWEFRRTPAGVAEELYLRTRGTHPDAAREEFRAIINKVNAKEVHLAIIEATSEKKAPTPSPSPAGS